VVVDYITKKDTHSIGDTLTLYSESESYIGEVIDVAIYPNMVDRELVYIEIDM
jgi:hypothetical protein